jgi:hypothetical protein
MIVCARTSLRQYIDNQDFFRRRGGCLGSFMLSVLGRGVTRNRGCDRDERKKNQPDQQLHTMYGKVGCPNYA